MLLVPDTVTAAEHAAKNGFIFTDAIPEIEVNTQKDESDPIQ